MQLLRDLLRRMAQEEKGQSIIEYALVASFIALGAFAVLSGLGFNIANSLYTILIKGMSVFFHLG